MLIRISAPHFTAGLEMENWIVTEAAPILKYMKDWKFEEVKRYIDNNRWELEPVDDPTINH